jgi:tetrapyrrole methylase family protein/MazG family protein
MEARQALSEAREVWLRTARHPAVAGLPEQLEVQSFDAFYDRHPTFEAVYAAITDRVLELARRPEGVLYAVPGHPLIAEATVAGLLVRCRDEGLAVRIIPGLSFVEPVLQALEVDPYSVQIGGSGGVSAEFPGLEPRTGGLQLVDALRPAVDPARPVQVGQVYSQVVASALQLELLEYYPPEHEIALVSAAGTPDQRVARLPLFELDRGQAVEHLTCVYLPPLSLTENTATFDGLAGIIARLRAPGGCPWDREQTHQTLKPYLIEEAYEALDALEREDSDALRGELGDLLLNILLHCQLAAEAGEFTARDVVRGIAEKLLRRHPHVFGEAEAYTPAQVVANWEALKQEERGEEASMLSGLPRALPALAYTRSLQERLAPLGLSRLAADDEELGVRLFQLAFQAAAGGQDPEEALRRANREFTERLERTERLAREAGSSIQQVPQDLREQLWRRAGGEAG